MKTHVFRVEIEQDEDGRWAAGCPILPGCATWGTSFEDALHNIEESVIVFIADMQDAGERIPPADRVIDAPAVCVVTTE